MTRSAPRARGLWLAMLLLSAMPVGCGPPTIGDDRAAFKTVDALFTAVSLRDDGQLNRCEANLWELQASGKLPESAATDLASIITEARGGAWEPAQSRLRKFMLGQRR